MLYAILSELELVSHIPEKGFGAALSGSPASVIGRLRSSLGIDIEPHKTEIADGLAHALNSASWEWLQNKEFMNRTELGRFLQFVWRIVQG